MSRRHARISPSILAADFVNLERDLHRISNADMVHVDVMDNHFVPNLTFGPQMVERIQAVAGLPLDVHLMIEDPERWAPGYAELGVASITFHAEATKDPFSLAKAIRERGAKAGIALRPGTPVEPYLEFLGDFDLVLVMTVEPGFGGQSFMPETMAKLDRVRAELDRWERGGEVRIQVDGGIDRTTILIAAEHGADTFVAGSAVFRSPDPGIEIDILRELANQHVH